MSNEDNCDIKTDKQQLNKGDQENDVEDVVVEVQVEVPEVEVTSDGPDELTDSSDE